MKMTNTNHPDQRSRTDPFDIIGDVHGCLPELRRLLEKLGYHVTRDNAVPPTGRTAVFVGDLVDRGPDSAGVLRLVMHMQAAGHALSVQGNHDAKLLKKLNGRNVMLTHGLEATLQELDAESPAFRNAVREFLEHMPSHYVFDAKRLAVAHAGIKESMLLQDSKAIRAFTLFGETTGQSDEYGLPVRLNWAEKYGGASLIVYGHTPVVRPLWQNNTVNIDTGCVFGGSLTALRYPEQTTVSVRAAKAYAEPSRPIDFSVLDEA